MKIKFYNLPGTKMRKPMLTKPHRRIWFNYVFQVPATPFYKQLEQKEASIKAFMNKEFKVE